MRTITLHDADGNAVELDALAVIDSRHIGEEARAAEAARLASLFAPCEVINLKDLGLS
jgi:hypothetical protein